MVRGGYGTTDIFLATLPSGRVGQALGGIGSPPVSRRGSLGFRAKCCGYLPSPRPLRDAQGHERLSGGGGGEFAAAHVSTETSFSEAWPAERVLEYHPESIRWPPILGTDLREAGSL